jgi:N-methylhydantoinase B
MVDPVALSIFASRIEAVCEEMGALLKRASFSPNIKDRLDFSCAVFDAKGELCAQAAHIPVHLGSMAFAMADIVDAHPWQPEDYLVVNDPYLGGTHLPDVTVIAPVFVDGALQGFVANRAHHANIGASQPGSMPIASSLEEEGAVIPPTLLARGDQIIGETLQALCGDSADPRLAGDFRAQVSACRLGVQRLVQLIGRTGLDSYGRSLAALNDYAEQLALDTFRAIPDGDYGYTDYMDDDGLGASDIPIQVRLKIRGGCVTADFEGTAPQVPGNINCPLSVAAAAVFYVFRCLLPEEAPACAGTFRPIRLQAPQGCLLNAKRPAAVAAGNVETSSRIVDVVLGALAKALPERIPAASHGSMNNVAMGAVAGHGQPAWDYYETLAGGSGAGPLRPGISARHTHMTNTLNTPVESLELHYPLRITRYQQRYGSGGGGGHKGGDGIVREFEFLADAQVTLLTERRRHAPWGLSRGKDGSLGENRHNGRPVSGKTALAVQKGDRLTVSTAGGGGWGQDTTA